MMDGQKTKPWRWGCQPPASLVFDLLKNPRSQGRLEKVDVSDSREGTEMVGGGEGLEEGFEDEGPAGRIGDSNVAKVESSFSG